MCLSRVLRIVPFVAVATLLAIVAAAITDMHAAFASSATADHPAGIVTYVVENRGVNTKNVLATFGSVFVPGDIPQSASISAALSDGTAVPVQIDAKANHPDGSLRYGVITLDIPDLAHGAQTSITLYAKNAAPASETTVALPTGFDTMVTLKTKDDVLTASTMTLLAAGHVEKWLSGPLVGEWWVSGPFRNKNGVADPHLHVEFGIRGYGKDKPVRIEADIENDWAYVPSPKTEFYDVEIKTNGKLVYSKTDLIQPSHTRWRLVFWLGESVDTYVKQNLAYLEKAHVVPNYDPATSVSDNSVSRLYDKFQSASHGPMTSGILEKYMPTTGGRADIGPLPQWQAVYLLTMDPRAYEVVLATADQGASFSAHYRNEKTDRPLTLEDYPEFSTHANAVGQGPRQLQLPDIGGYKDPLVPDASHEPALDFVPYLVTGDRFYLEELQFWAEWNLTGTAPASRDFAKGLVKFDQVRAQAWSLRALAQAEYITPDNDSLKDVFRRQLKANIDWYDSNYVTDPSANPLHFIPQRGEPYDNGRAMAPWQDDFFTWSVGYVQGLGDVDAFALLRWKGSFPVQRMIAPGFCWILASSYTLRVRDSAQGDFYPSFGKVYDETLSAKIKNPTQSDAKPACASADLAEALGLRNAGEMVNGAATADGEPALMQPALAAAVDGGAPGAQQAWRLFQSRSVKPDFSSAPQWSIVPRIVGAQ